MWPENKCTAIVPIVSKYTLGNTLGLPRYNNWIIQIIYLTTEATSIFVGLILGDAHLSRSSSKSNYKIGFKPRFN